MSKNQEIGTTLVKTTDKQRRFIEEYCVDFNASRAARRSGYSEPSARNIGCENLTKPYIRAAIRERLNELTMNSAEAAMRLTRWGRGSIEPFMRITGDGEFVVDLSTAEAQDQLDLIRRIKQTEQTIRRKDGTQYTIIRTEIELHDAKDAVVQMVKLNGMFKDGGDDEGRGVLPTREEVAETWEKLKRIQSVEKLEELMINAAKRQLAANGG